jgi:ribose-phosphate pyrophosphokinase
MRQVAHYLGVSPLKTNIRAFADSETFVEVLESVRGSDVFLMQPVVRSFLPDQKSVNDALVELILMVACLRRASARSICVVIPYYGLFCAVLCVCVCARARACVCVALQNHKR